MQRIVLNQAKATELHQKGRAKLNQFRNELTASINNYKKGARYRSLNNRYQKALPLNANLPKPIRLKDVEELENIVRNARTTTELKTNVLNYTNGKDKFRGAGHLSRLRTGLNAALKKFVAKNNLADIDDFLRLATEAEQNDQAVNPPVAEVNVVEKSEAPQEQLTDTEEEAPPPPPPPREAEPEVIDNKAIQAELANVKRQLRANNETLNEQKACNKKLLTQIEVRDKHLQAANATICAQKEAIVTLQEEAKGLAASHQAYVTETETLISRLQTVLGKVKLLLKRVTRTEDKKPETENKKTLLSALKGIVEKVKISARAKDKILEVKKQMTAQQGEIFDLLNKGQVAKGQKDLEATHTAQITSQLAAKAKFNHLPQIIDATSKIAAIEPSKDLPPMVDYNALATPVPPPFPLSDSEDDTPPAPAPRDHEENNKEDDKPSANNNISAPSPLEAAKLHSFARTTGTLFTASGTALADIASAAASLKKVTIAPPKPEATDGVNPIAAALQERLAGMRASLVHSDSEDEEEDKRWGLTN